MADKQEPCTCASCAPVNTEVICQTFAQSAMRYSDGSSTAALLAINANQHLTNQFTAQAQQQLESTNASRQAGDQLLGQLLSRIPIVTP